jgi:O-succinylbenzoic acid--CoA ligase
VSDFLSRRVTATPDRTAVVDATDGREWTYRELDDHVEDCVTRLRRRVDAPAESVRVGTLLSPRPEFAVFFHAAMRLGWTVVGLDTQLAPPELDAALERTDPDLLVCERESVVDANRPVVSVDDTGDCDTLDPFAGASVTTAGVDAFDPAETAALLFTSGTTGEPRAVRLTGRNLHASTVASALRLGVTPGGRWLDCLPVYHAGGLAPVVRCAIQGTTLVLQRSFGTDQTARVVDEFDVTGISLVPTQLRRLLAAGASLPSLETVLLGGAPAPESLLARARDTDLPVYPTYGLTETASQAATATPEEAKRHPGTVGQPLYRTEITIVDDGDPVERGESGEIVVDGPTVTPGYLDDDGSFCEYGLRTGDVGYRDADGRLYVVGRRDEMVLSGGELVAPREVADAIREHPAVTDAAVVGVDDPTWGQRVATLVITEHDLDASTLREHCRERLADYRCPKTVAFAERLPRTASGTVDRERVRERLTNGE